MKTEIGDGKIKEGRSEKKFIKNQKKMTDIKAIKRFKIFIITIPLIFLIIVLVFLTLFYTGQHF